MTNPAPDFTLLTADRLIDGTGSPPLERGAVLLEGDRIVAVGTEEAVVPPEGATVEEVVYEGKTILPGLVDCHVHLNGIGDGRPGDDLATLPDEILTVQSANNARAHLYSGVTTVRDCGAKNRTTFLLREAVDMGIAVAPRLVLSGRPVAVIGGHLSYFGIQATGPTECRAAVRQLIKEGADFIKVTASGGSTRTSFPFVPSFNVDELTAIAEEAHKFGKHVAAHCVNSESMRNCLDAGFDTLIHARHMESDGTYKYSEDVTERIVEQGVYVNMTLNESRANYHVISEKHERGERLTEREEQVFSRGMEGYDLMFDSFARMVEAGAQMAAGSDTSWSWHKIAQFQDEIEAHVAGGMSPMDAIVAGTLNSAKSCWVDDEVGSLHPGKAADVLVVDGDPSKDITHLWNVVDIYQSGAKIDRVAIV